MHADLVADVVETWDDAQRLDRPPLLVIGPLRAFLDRAGLGAGEVKASRIGEGHSNVTFLIERAGFEGVLRRPPRPPYPPKAHDVLREARIQTGLAETAVPVPRILAVCEDEGTIGSPFYLMSRVRGDVVTTRLPTYLRTPAARTLMVEDMVDTLVALHTVAPEEAGLRAGPHRADPDKRLRFFDRMWRANATRAVPDLDATRGWLGTHLPPAGPVALTHGDYRIGNLMFAADGAVTAVLDWEIARIDDPLADLGYLLSTYPEPGDPPSPLLDMGSVVEDGFPGRAAVALRYAEATGQSLEHLRWYVAFAFWRVAIGLEGIHRQSLACTTDDVFARDLEHGVPQLAACALATARGGFI